MKFWTGKLESPDCSHFKDRVVITSVSVSILLVPALMQDTEVSIKSQSYKPAEELAAVLSGVLRHPEGPQLPQWQ